MSISEAAHELVLGVQRLPDSDQQRALTVQARYLSQRIQTLIGTLEASEGPFYEAMKELGVSGISKPSL